MDKVVSERRLRPGLATLVGILCPGLGYLYVGRLRFALATVLAIFAVVAVAGWTRLILWPPIYYVTVALVLLVYVVSIVHPGLIASRTKVLMAKPYNRVWVYLLWFASLVAISNITPLYRADVFGFELFRIPSSSMMQLLQPGDRIIVDTWRYRRQDPELNELVVFDVPESPSVKYVFRVVGQPGDTLELRNNVLFRNDVAIQEEFVLLSGRISGRSSDFARRVVPEGHFFVLGDNRHNARDSRFLGPIPREALHGRVEYRFFAYDEGISWSRFPAVLANAKD